MNTLKEMPLFNGEGDDSPELQELINGNPTGISNLNENKFKWANKLYRTMTANFWIPEKVSLTDDATSIKELTESEDLCTKTTLSFLIFLDSYQCINLPNLKKYITAPNVANLIAIQEFQEVIHSQSYQYILDSLYPLMTRESIYNKWRDDPHLLQRIKYVTDIGNEFIQNPTINNFKKVIVMNLLLESVYFYQGFMYFDQLSSRNKLVQSSKIIDYIRRDEITHIGIFVNIIKEIFTEEDNDLIVNMFKIAARQEIEWAEYIFGDNILGISSKSSKDYIHYLVNDRLRMIGISPIFSQSSNPYAHLEQKSKENFFETTVTSYDRSESINGWEF